jgi:hypothetical protein
MRDVLGIDRYCNAGGDCSRDAGSLGVHGAREKVVSEDAAKGSRPQ